MRATTGKPRGTADAAPASIGEIVASPGTVTAGSLVPADVVDNGLANGTPPAHAVLLVVAVAAGVVADGGYYPAGRILVCASTLAAAAAALWNRRVAPDRGRALALAAAALGSWIVIRAVLALWSTHNTGDALLPALAALATLASVVAVPAILLRTGHDQREWLAGAVFAVGCLVAVTAWAGVAWHLPRFAILVDGRLWRGGSTLTYQNAAAAMLAMLAVPAVAARAGQPRSGFRAGVAYLLLVGVGAAASRAGFIALAVGLLALGVLAGIRATAARLVAPLLGAAVAVGALIPSFPAHGAPRPYLAVAGLLLGAAMATGPALLAHRLPRRVRLAALAAVPVGAALLLTRLVGTSALRAVLASRGNLASEGRTGALHAAWTLIAARPVTGTGIGLARFVWPTADGNVSVALYVHDEYLQVLVDLGAVGVVLLAILAGAIVVFIRRGRRLSHRPGLWPGAIGGLAAFAVHSGFDFLWHIPVLPLIAALLVGLAGPGGTEEPIQGKEQEE